MARLIDSHDPERTRFREQVAAHCREAWERRQQWATRTENVEILVDGVMKQFEYPATPDPEVDGPPPLYLGDKPTLAGEYAALAAIYDRQIDEVREQIGRQLPLLDPWPVGCEHPEQYAMLLHFGVPKLEPKHSDLVSGFLSDVRADLGATGDGMETPKAITPTTDTLTGEAKALAVLVQHPEWNDKQIAEAAGCSRTSLYRWGKFKAAREVLRSRRTTCCAAKRTPIRATSKRGNECRIRCRATLYATLILPVCRKNKAQLPLAVRHPCDTRPSFRRMTDDRSDQRHPPTGGLCYGMVRGDGAGDRER